MLMVVKYFKSRFRYDEGKRLSIIYRKFKTKARMVGVNGTDS